MRASSKIEAEQRDLAARVRGDHPDEEPYRQYVIKQIGLAAIRARMINIELKFIGVALDRGWISPDEAMQWAAGIGAADLVQPEEATAHE